MATTISPTIFREYDIRGVVDQDLTEEVVRLIGQGLGTLVRRAGGRRVVVGRDCRLSGERFARQVMAGLNATGVDVVDLGVVPTPLTYFAAQVLPVHGLCVITGSHNPPEYNGVKFFDSPACHHRPEIYGGMAEAEASVLLKEFFRERR